MQIINQRKNTVNKIKLEKNRFSNQYNCCYCDNNKNDIEFIEKLNDDKLYKCQKCGSSFIQLNDTDYFLSEPSQQIKNKQILIERNKRLKSIIFYSSFCITCLSIIGLISSSFLHNILLFQITYITFAISLICTIITGVNRANPE